MKTSKILQVLLFLVAVAVLCAQSRGAEADAVKAELAKLQGEWSMVSGAADGQSMPDEMLSSCKRVCKGDEVTVKLGEQTIMSAKITLDPSKNPKTIDYQVTEGPNKGKKMLGIYQVEGDVLKACFAAPDDERPKEFAGKEGEHRTLSEWKRVKAAAPAPATPAPPAK